MTEEQFIGICKWQKETFGQANMFSKIAHLAEELREVIETKRAHENGSATLNDVELEFADCFLLLFGAANAAGMTYDDICNAVEEKMKINRSRKWGTPDEFGVVNHIKDETQ
jgi:NTP pyrophosphatase (non-canonical NTP hydrolase)